MKILILAAHCIYGKDLKEKQPEDITVLLGAHNLAANNEVGRTTLGVESIHTHNNWNPMVERFDADIAVLILNEEVEFNHYIQPACMAKVGINIKDFTEGVIVGFGKTENSVAHSDVPRKADTPIKKSIDCYHEFPRLVNIASYRTACGGHANGTGSCTGDSGGGLTVVSGG